MLFYLEGKLSDKTDFLTHNLVEFLVLVVGIRRKVFVKIILGYCVYDIVCHDEFFNLTDLKIVTVD